MDLSKSLSSLQDLAIEKEREKKEIIFNMYDDFLDLSSSGLNIFYHRIEDLVENDSVDSHILMFYLLLIELWRSK